MTSPVRIGLRVRSNPAWMGGVMYTLNWALALGSLPEDERPDVYLLYVQKEGRDLADLHRDLVKGVAPFGDAQRLGLDMVYPATQIFEAPFMVPWAGWIPDWQHAHMPEMFNELELARRAAHYPLLARHAPLLVVSSQMAHNDTCRLVAGPLTKVEKLAFPAFIDDAMINPPEGEIANTLERHGLPRKFFLVCNQFWKHKNHIVVFRALARLANKGVVCVFTGETSDPRWPGYFGEIEAFIRAEGLEKSALILGCIGREDQLRLIRAALAVIQPSRFEGWSTIVEESRAMGKKTLLSRFPVHEEQSPPGCRFFDPDDDERLAELMGGLWEDNPPEPGPEELAESAQQRKEHITTCARRLVEMAVTVKQRYNPKIHDPKIVVLHLLKDLAEKRDDSVGLELFGRALAGARAMLSADPDQTRPFANLADQLAPAIAGEIRKKVISPVNATSGMTGTDHIGGEPGKLAQVTGALGRLLAKRGQQ